MVIERVWFHEVDDVESVSFACFGIRDSEVVPLGVASSIVIRLQN